MPAFSHQTPVQFSWKWILYKLTLVSQSGWPLPRVPLNQGGPRCSSPAWPRMATGSDRFWLPELRVSGQGRHLGPTGRGLCQGPRGCRRIARQPRRTQVANAFLRTARLLLARDLEPFSRLEHDGSRARLTLDPGGPGDGILGDRREGVVMDGQNEARLEQLDGTDGIVGTHRVVVADRQDRQVEPFLADQGHVAEKSRVRRVIQLDPIGAGDEEAAGVAPVATIRKRRAVECQGQLDTNSAVERVAAAVLETVHLGQSARRLLEPGADLVVGKDRRAGSLRDRHRVAHVVAVTM